MVESDDRDVSIFDEIIRALEQHSHFEDFRLRDESILSPPGLDIFLRRRKAYSGYTEITLTTKEFGTFCLAVVCSPFTNHRLFFCPFSFVIWVDYLKSASFILKLSVFLCHNLRPNIAFLLFRYRFIQYNSCVDILTWGKLKTVSEMGAIMEIPRVGTGYSLPEKKNKVLQVSKKFMQFREENLKRIISEEGCRM